MIDLKLEFKTKMQKTYDDFERNMMQGEHFQLQEKLSESIIADIKRNQSFVNSTPALAIYDTNANNLKNTGKTFKNILEEKAFTDSYRIFEEFLAKTFTNIYTVFPYFYFLNDKEDDSKVLKEIPVPIDYIFGNANIDEYRIEYIEMRIKSYMQKSTILKALERFGNKLGKTGFCLVMNLDEDKKLECQRMALIRNLMTHNNSIVNTVYLNSIKQFKIQGNAYQINDSILPNLESEIHALRSVVRDLARQIKQDLDREGNLKKMENWTK